MGQGLLGSFLWNRPGLSLPVPVSEKASYHKFKAKAHSPVPQGKCTAAQRASAEQHATVASLTAEVERLQVRFCRHRFEPCR